MFSTPYYRTFTVVPNIGTGTESTFKYNSYNLFCLETRLYPYIYKLLNRRDVIIYFKGIEEDNRMNLKILLSERDNKITLSDKHMENIQEKINEITSVNEDYCLIDKDELYYSLGSKINQGWYNQILQYVNFNTEYNPFIKPEGIYLAINPESDFNTAYNEVCNKIVKQIDDLYENGAVLHAESIKDDWLLETIDINEMNTEIYQPMWKDYRFAPNLVDFLLEKIRKNPYISIKIPDNLVKRHFISFNLSNLGKEVIFENTEVKIKVDNLDEAQRVASLVDQGIKTGYGRVITFQMKTVDDVLLMIQVAKKQLNDPECTGYRISNPNEPYIFSCLLNEEDRNVSNTVRIKLFNEFNNIKNRAVLKK